MYKLFLYHNEYAEGECELIFPCITDGAVYYSDNDYFERIRIDENLELPISFIMEYYTDGIVHIDREMNVEAYREYVSKKFILDINGPSSDYSIRIEFSDDFYDMRVIVLDEYSNHIDDFMSNVGYLLSNDEGNLLSKIDQLMI